MSEFKGSKIKGLIRQCSELEHGNYLGGCFNPSLVQVENELDKILDEHKKMLEMLEDILKESEVWLLPDNELIKQLIKEATTL